MILTVEYRSTRRKSCPTTTSFATNSRQCPLGLNTSIGGYRPANTFPHPWQGSDPFHHIHFLHSTWKNNEKLEFQTSAYNVWVTNRLSCTCHAVDISNFESWSVEVFPSMSARYSPINTSACQHNVLTTLQRHTAELKSAPDRRTV